MRMSSKDVSKLLLSEADTKHQFARLVSSVAEIAKAFAAMEVRLSKLEKTVAKSCYTNEDI